MVHDAFQAYVFSNGFLQPPAGRQHPVAVTQVMMPMLQAWCIWKEAFARSPMGPGVGGFHRWEDREDPFGKIQRWHVWNLFGSRAGLLSGEVRPDLFLVIILLTLKICSRKICLTWPTNLGGPAIWKLQACSAGGYAASNCLPHAASHSSLHERVRCAEWTFAPYDSFDFH